jgi:hypothetical protein
MCIIAGRLGAFLWKNVIDVIYLSFFLYFLWLYPILGPENQIEYKAFLILLPAILFLILRELNIRRQEAVQTRHYRNIWDGLLEFVMKLCFIGTSILFLAFLLSLTRRLWTDFEYFAEYADGRVPVDITKMHISLIALLISGFGVAGAWWAHSLQKRFKTFDAHLRSLKNTKRILAQNVLQSAEIAVHQLMANPAYTQQISSGAVHGLQFLDSVIGSHENDESGIMESLKDSKNHAMLRYAYATYLLGLDPEHHEAITNLDDVIENCKKSGQLLLLAQYRKAIFLRQVGEYAGAKQIYQDVLGDGKVLADEFLPWRIRMNTGLLITELAQKPLWCIENDRLKIQEPANATNVIEKIREILRLQKGPERLEDNVKYYLLKAAARLKSSANAELWTGISEGDREFIQNLMSTVRTEYNNVYNNYWDDCIKSPGKYVDGYCIILLENFKFCMGMLNIYEAIFTDEASEKQNLINTAKDVLQHMLTGFKVFEENINEMGITLPQRYIETIYSEKLEREVKIHKFENELKEIVNYLSIDTI